MSLTVLLIVLHLSLVVAVPATFGTKRAGLDITGLERRKRPRRSECHLEALPLDLLLEITDRLPDLESTLQLSLTSHSLRDRLSSSLMFHSLLHHSIRHWQLSSRIRYCLQHLKHDPVLHTSRIITPELAIGLVDRLLQCIDLTVDETLKFINWFLGRGHPVVYELVVLALGDQKAAYPTMLETIADHRHRSASVSDIPAHIIESIQQIVQQLSAVSEADRPRLDQVRARYPSPFNQVFPDNRKVAYQLLSHLKETGRLQLLADPRVVLQLLQNGIRFVFAEFILKVHLNAAHISDIYPLLYRPSSRSRKQIYQNIIKPLRELIQNRKGEIVIELLKIGEVTLILRSHPVQFVTLFNVAIAKDLPKLIEYLIEQPYIYEIINGVHNRISPLHKAFSCNRVKIVNLLMKVPALDLQRPGWNKAQKSPFSLMNARSSSIAELLQSVPADRAPVLFRTDPGRFVRFIKQMWDRVTLIESVLGQPYMPEFINVAVTGHNQTLLHECCRESKFKVLGPLLAVDGIDPSLTDQDGKVAFQYLDANTFLSMLHDPHVSVEQAAVLVRSQPRHLFEILRELKDAGRDVQVRAVLDHVVMPTVINSADHDTGHTLLHLAFINDRIDIVSELLPVSGVNLRLVDRSGRVPFSYLRHQSVSLMFNRIPPPKIIQLIHSDLATFVALSPVLNQVVAESDTARRSLSAIVRAVDRDRGFTLLHYAFDRHYMPLISVLMKIPGIDINRLDRQEHVPFHYFSPTIDNLTQLRNTLSDEDIRLLVQSDVSNFLDKILNLVHGCSQSLNFIMDQPFVSDIRHIPCPGCHQTLQQFAIYNEIQILSTS